MSEIPENITIAMMRESFYSAVVSDVLDSAGYRHQCISTALAPMTGVHKLVGRAKTTQWEDVDSEDPKPYELELKAIDECQPDDLFIAAAAGSMRSGIWGELLSTASRNVGCAGAIIDGAIRDIAPMREMKFGVFAAGANPYDSLHRQRVTAVDVPVQIGGVTFNPGDWVIADDDGIVVIPQEVENEVIHAAWEKIHAEHEVRDSIRDGMSASAAFEKYAIL
ncbi:MAG: RraA family protein [Verrucomicrobiales bacterium]|nr:RraA family protein [Verrucomicrobiales bacterium]